MSWSQFGSLIALAVKDGNLIVFDPRSDRVIAQVKAHDSPRSFQTAWVDEAHVVSVGFSKGSTRRLNLYSMSSDTADLKLQQTVMIDVGPAVLFPHFDSDTSILYVWGKGERTISPYFIDIEAKEPITKLPAYTGANPHLGIAWWNKAQVDVKKVEVARCLRLTGKTMEEVLFRIPRNKVGTKGDSVHYSQQPDFFQDDIFIPTLNRATPRVTAAAWLAGDDGEPTYISLRPEGMTALSEAPQTSTPAKKKFVPASDVMSEEETKRQEMDRLFMKAKLEESDEEQVAPKGLAPPDDDW